MVWPFDSQHSRNVQFKRKQRSERISALKEYHSPLNRAEQRLLNQNVEDIVKQVKAGDVTSRDVLKAYGKKALLVHASTNALTEIMIKEAETWADDANLEGPLAGFPVSLKDGFIVSGFDATAGYSIRADKPFKEDGALVKIIKAAGGYPYVKTNIPITMMTFEGYNDLWGLTVNPYNPDYAAGGSSQGEGALIGGGGSRIGVGTDIGGSVRVPAAWSGLYSLRMTAYRFPFDGNVTSDRGFEGIPSVASPMASSLKDLRYFTEAIFSVKPWKYDYHLIPLPWRKDASVPEKPRVGVLDLEDLLPLTPAQKRALSTTVDALKKRGCEIVDFKPPVPSHEYYLNAAELGEASGYKGFSKALLWGEHNDPYVQSVINSLRMPDFLLTIWRFMLRLLGFKEYAHSLAHRRHFTVSDYEGAVARRETLRRHFRTAWDQEGFDFVVTAPHPSPGISHAVKNSICTHLYTGLFNLLDYPAGIVPVGRVDATLDKLPPSYDLSKLTPEGRISFRYYDAEKMAGLPTAVQVVGLRYQDEETLAAMEYVEEALKDIGVSFTPNQ